MPERKAKVRQKVLLARRRRQQQQVQQAEAVELVVCAIRRHDLREA